MNQEDPKSCRALHKLFLDEGVNMRPEHFSNPPEPGQDKGDIGVEVGLQAMLDRFQIGTLKAFSTLGDWFGEIRIYHRDKNGKVVKLRDDLMAATRYAVMSVRHAYTKPI